MGNDVVMANQTTGAIQGGQQRWFGRTQCKLVKYDPTLQLTNPDSLKLGEPVILYVNSSGEWVMTNAAVAQYEGPNIRFGVVPYALDKVLNKDKWIWVPIEGPVDALRYYHTTGTTDAVGTYLRILIDQSVDAIGHTGNSTTERCADIEATALVSTAASIAVLAEAVDTAVASGVVTKKATLIGALVDPAVQA